MHEFVKNDFLLSNTAGESTVFLINGPIQGQIDCSKTMTGVDYKLCLPVVVIFFKFEKAIILLENS